MSLLWVSGWAAEGDGVVLTFAFNKSLRVIRQGCVFVLFWFFIFFPARSHFPIEYYNNNTTRSRAAYNGTSVYRWGGECLRRRAYYNIIYRYTLTIYRIFLPYVI